MPLLSAMQYIVVLFLFTRQSQRDDQKFQIKGDDLVGFWDMVTIQVEEIKSAFEQLDRLKENGWQGPNEEDIRV